VIQERQEDLPMSDQFWLTKAQLKRIDPFFPLSHGIPRVDDRHVEVHNEDLADKLTDSGPESHHAPLVAVFELPGG
jgi:hypothetical protein